MTQRETERFVPGVAQPVGPPRPAVQTAEDDAEDRWDAHPLLKRTTAGKDVELFMVAALAKALNRTVHAIYKWEQKGVLPKAQYGKKVSGAWSGAPRRLYTRAQIEGLIRIATEEGLMTGKKPLAATQFAQRAARLFKGDPNA